MFDITKLALKIPNFLTNEECDGLINEFEQREKDSIKERSKNFYTSKIEDSTYKVIHLSPNTDNFNLIREKTKEVINQYLNYLSKPKYFFIDTLRDNLKYSHAYRIMKYEEGDEIHPHSDYDPGIYGSVSFNLNDNYEGGKFQFFNGNYTVKLKKGDALIFPADYFWVHQVTPVTKGVRYSINSFITNNPYHSNVLGNKITQFLGHDYKENTPKENLLGPYN